MVQFDNQYRQIKIKIVYYGPALGGKTTCLQQVHAATDPDRRTKLYSLATANDRTLFFDLMSLDLGRIRGYRLSMQLYTVPGQVQYNATRRTVLAGADGVVFVADSRVDQRQANEEALANLVENLRANGIDDALPVVFQLNKRDLDPVLDVDEMNRQLNPDGAPAFPTVAIAGTGVMEGFAAIGELTLAAVADKLGVAQHPQTISRLQQRLREALEPHMSEQAQGPPGIEAGLQEGSVEALGVAAEEIRTVRVLGAAEDAAPGEPLSQDLLLGEAVRANIAMTDLNTRLDTMHRQLERKVAVLRGIDELSRKISGIRDPDEVLSLLLKTTARLLRADATAVLLDTGQGSLREAALHRLTEDPVLAATGDTGEPLAYQLAMDRSARLIVPEVEQVSVAVPELAETPDAAAPEHASPELRPLREALQRCGYESGLVVPMAAHDRTVGLLTAYATSDREPLDEDDLQLAGVLAASAAMGHASAQAWKRLEELNQNLEAQVEERTARLKESLSETSRLADDLEEKNLLLERAHHELSELDHLKKELLTRISHELKTPVSSLLTATKILQKSAPMPPAKSERFIEVIRQEAQKLSEIVRSTINASVLSSPATEVTRKDVPVQDLFKRAVAPLIELSREREVQLQVLIPSSLGVVLCDAETMEIALRAVVKNAIEFNRKGGEVKVELRRTVRDGITWLMLRISDTGVGIPAPELEHAFEAFWQGGNVLAGRPKGIGLGLTIAKRIIELHGGSITVQSTVGEGTKVTVAIPQSKAHGSSGSGQESGGRPQARGETSTEVSSAG